MVVGGKILDGVLQSKVNLRVIREKEQIGVGELVGLKVVNEDVDELQKDQECGVRYRGKLRLQEGDILEAWKEEKRMKTL